LQTKFDKRIKTIGYVGEAEHQNKNLWLLKPTGYNRGIGIHVFNSVDDLKSILWNHYRINVYALGQGINVEAKEAADPEQKELKSFQFIVQKYIEKPLLFKLRKFDIRQWALINHDGKCYMFKEAYVRTSSEQYDLSDQKMD
jgi:tubulin---tyrosine ligase